MAAAGANGNWFAFHPFHWTIVLGMGMYVAGITLWARREAETILRRELLLAVWVMIAGIGLFVALEKVSRPPEVVWAINGPWIWPALLLLLSAPLVRRLARAIRSCLPGDVQAAVGQAIGNLIFYDAALCLAVGEPSVAIGVLVLVLPMRLLGRWLYST